MRWISKIALQIYLQGADKVSEGANGSEGVHTAKKRYERLGGGTHT
jgi:hypothetical protein